MTYSGNDVYAALNECASLLYREGRIEGRLAAVLSGTDHKLMIDDMGDGISSTRGAYDTTTVHTVAGEMNVVVHPMLAKHGTVWVLCPDDGRVGPTGRAPRSTSIDLKMWVASNHTRRWAPEPLRDNLFVGVDFARPPEIGDPMRALRGKKKQPLPFDGFSSLITGAARAKVDGVTGYFAEPLSFEELDKAVLAAAAPFKLTFSKPIEPTEGITETPVTWRSRIAAHFAKTNNEDD